MKTKTSYFVESVKRNTDNPIKQHEELLVETLYRLEEIINRLNVLFEPKLVVPNSVSTTTTVEVKHDVGTKSPICSICHGLITDILCECDKCGALYCETCSGKYPACPECEARKE